MTENRHSESNSQLPIYVNDYVLGANIGVRQRDNGPTDVIPTGTRPYINEMERRYIAEWARRNLFKGAKPR